MTASKKMNREITDAATLRDALSALGADDIDHHGRPLSVHLIGTYALLGAWGNPDFVALAGAFHSIYGTEEFAAKAQPLSRRGTIARLIGTEAENLAYAFCIADRRALYNVPIEGPFHMVTPAHGHRVAISRGTYAALLEIEVANIVEQAANQKGVPQAVVQFWLRAFESRRLFLSRGAVAAYRVALADYEARGA